MCMLHIVFALSGVSAWTLCCPPALRLLQLWQRVEQLLNSSPADHGARAWSEAGGVLSYSDGLKSS